MTDRNKAQTWADKDATQAYNRDTVFRVRVVFAALWQKLLEQHAAHPLKRVLDYGCGGGLFFKTCPKDLHTVSFVGYDISPPMLETARSACEEIKKPSLLLTDNLTTFPKGCFDAVVCIAVWPNWSSHEMCIENLKTIHPLLSPHGTAFFAVTHPERVEYDTEYDFHLLPQHRATPGFRFEITRKGHLHKGIKPTVNYVWPLPIVEQQLREAGFCKKIEITEFPPEGNAPHSSWACVVARASSSS